MSGLSQPDSLVCAAMSSAQATPREEPQRLASPQTPGQLQRHRQPGAEVMGGSPARPRSALSRPVAGAPVVVGPGERVMLSGTGLQLPRKLPFERWLSIGRQLSAVCTSAAWCLGDWLVFGEQAYAGRYRQAIERTSLDYQTLRNYAWVARRFAMSRRRDTLSFGHHAEVAALPEPEQDFWLRKAEEDRWPVKQLRRQVRASLAERSAGQDDRSGPGRGRHDGVVLSLQIRISPGQLATCRAAADRANLSIEAWTVLALEHAAQHELGSAETPPLGLLSRAAEAKAPALRTRPRLPQVAADEGGNHANQDQ